MNFMYLATADAAGTLANFLTSATEMLTWIITSIGSILNFSEHFLLLAHSPLVAATP